MGQASGLPGSSLRATWVNRLPIACFSITTYVKSGKAMKLHRGQSSSGVYYLCSKWDSGRQAQAGDISLIAEYIYI